MYLCQVDSKSWSEDIFFWGQRLPVKSFFISATIVESTVLSLLLANSQSNHLSSCLVCYTAVRNKWYDWLWVMSSSEETLNVFPQDRKPNWNDLRSRFPETYVRRPEKKIFQDIPIWTKGGSWPIKTYKMCSLPITTCKIVKLVGLPLPITISWPRKLAV